MNNHNHNGRLYLSPDEGDVGPPPRDEMDGLLREWHQANAARAAAGRDRLMAALGAENRSAESRVAPQAATDPEHTHGTSGDIGRNEIDANLERGSASNVDDSHTNTWSITVRRIAMNRPIQLAVAAALVLVALPLFFQRTSKTAVADSNLVYCPDGGRLEARDAVGQPLGPCVLKHTDVKAVVQGHFTRVTVKQKYHNPHKDKIEALYTFPLSHRGAVDRMNMTVGDRVIVGQVKERDAAKQMYESAKAQGLVTSLLEQERPNIFTQNIANIDPGTDIDIEISYVETLETKDGQYTFSFPTVVSPRYIPGEMPRWMEDRERRVDAGNGQNGIVPPPTGFSARRGLVLAAPAEVKLVGWRNDADRGEFDASTFAAALGQAVAVSPPLPKLDDGKLHDDTGAGSLQPADAPTLYQFEVVYADGERERGDVRTDFTGAIGGRWFYLPQRDKSYRVVTQAPPAGEQFGRPTSQVPDANRITPTPVRPPYRSGHDISMTVEVDTGGAGLLEMNAPLHQTARQDVARRADGLASRATITLANQTEIPNRDFVLTWKQTTDAISEGVFTSSTKQGDFFAVILNPPARVVDEQAVPRELIFVLDTSGSMAGNPIEKAKSLAAKMVETMRPRDTFNFITFAGATSVLWPQPRPNNEQNRREALAFFANKGGSGGTEMMSAINAALEQRQGGVPVTITLEDLANMPADGRVVTVNCLNSAIERVAGANDTPADVRLRVRPNLAIRTANLDWSGGNPNAAISVLGEWTTIAGDRVFKIRSITVNSIPAANPLRIVVFLTDGEVGNDGAIIDAIKRNRGTTRVFTYGIGNAVNRYLLAEAAKQGGGDSEFIIIPRDFNGVAAEDVLRMNNDADAAAKRLHEKTRTPVLANISLEFSPNLSIADMEPAPGQIPDLYDVKPLVLLGRFTQPGEGTVTIRGTTGAGLWERTLKLSLQPKPANTDQRLTSVGGDGVVATLWARARIDALMNADLRNMLHGNTPAELRRKIVQIGENFGIMSQFTSFVAVDYQRVTIDGRTRLIRVPIELPDQTAWENYFCMEVLAEPVERLSRFVEEEVDVMERQAEARNQTSMYRELAMKSKDSSGGSNKRLLESAKKEASTSVPTAAPGAAPDGGRRGAGDPAPSKSAVPAAPATAAAPSPTPAVTPPPPPAPEIAAAPTAARPGTPTSGQTGTPSPAGSTGGGGAGGNSSPPADAASATRESRPTAKTKQIMPALTDQVKPGAVEGEKISTMSAANGHERGEQLDKVFWKADQTYKADTEARLGAIRKRGYGDTLGLAFGRSADELRAAAEVRYGGALQDLDGEATAESFQNFLQNYSYSPVDAKGEAGLKLDTPHDEFVGGLQTQSLQAELTPRRLVPLTAAKLIAAAVRTGKIDAAVRFRDQFVPQFRESVLLKEAAALIPAPVPVTGSDAPANPGGSDPRVTTVSPVPPGDVAVVDALVKRIDETATRERLLARRLDLRVYAMLPGASTEAASKDSGKGELLVTILLKDVGEETLTALKKAGFKVRSTIKGETCVVGTMALGDLEAVTLVEGVRRIELVNE